MLAASATWDTVANELYTTASAYRAIISDLVSQAWQGPIAAVMAAAITPYVQWLNTTAAQVEQTAKQTKAAAAAYEAAFAATVPPPVIAANRSLYATLVATNFLGTNTMAIAATEALYLDMWAQDAVAMYVYATDAAIASRVTPFTEPPQTTSQNGLPAQAAAVQSAGSTAASNVTQQLSGLIAQAPTALHSLSTAATGNPLGWLTSGSSNIATALGDLTGPYSPFGPLSVPAVWWLTALQTLGLAQNAPGIAALLNGPAPITGALGPLQGGFMSMTTPVAPSAVYPGASLASMGQSSSIGSLSVPASWSSAAPAARTVSAVSAGSSLGPTASAAAADGQAGLFGEMALSSLAGRGVGATASHPVIGTAARVVDSAAYADEEDGNAVTILVIQPNGE